MIQQILKLFFLIFMVFIISCNIQEERDIEIQFKELKQHLKEYSFTEESLKYFDKASIEYIDKLIEYCNKDNYYEAGELGGHHNCRLNSLVIFETVTRISKSDSTSINKVETSDFFLWTKFIGSSFFRLDGSSRFKFKKVTDVNGKEGYVNVIFNLGDNKTFISSKFRYVKEAGQWKLNFPSTMKFEENLLKQQLKRSHKSEADFIGQYLSDESIDGSFYYRAN